MKRPSKLDRGRNPKTLMKGKKHMSKISSACDKLRGLRDEAVARRDSQQAGHEDADTQDEVVPVIRRSFLQVEIVILRKQARHVVVEDEEDRDDGAWHNRERNCPSINVRQVDEQVAISGRLEAVGHVHARHAGGLRAPDVRHARPQHQRDGGSVVRNDLAGRAVQDLPGLGSGKQRGQKRHARGENELQESPAEVLVREVLDDAADSSIQVDNGNQDAEGLTREARHVSNVVARVGCRQRPMHDRGPDLRPRIEWQEVDAQALRHVENGDGQDAHGARDAQNDQRLAPDDGKDGAGNRGGQQNFHDSDHLRLRQ
eukprot:scaffold1435_cov267-Pinguiococcus_pyrenoidosus.AAC.35